MIDQDNMSTLTMIENGRATGPTSRHINIRFFWLNDRISSGEVSMRYIPTGNMTSDKKLTPCHLAAMMKN